MRILIMAIGSLGDILPFVALGAALQRCGHEVRMYGNAYLGATGRPWSMKMAPNGPARCCWTP